MTIQIEPFLGAKSLGDCAIGKHLTTVFRSRKMLAHLLILFTVPLVIGFFSIYQHTTDSRIKYSAITGTADGEISMGGLVYSLDSNESFICGVFNGLLEFGEFNGTIEGVFTGSINGTHVGRLNSTLGLGSNTLSFHGSIRGYFKGHMLGILKDSTIIPVLLSVSMIVAYAIWMLIRLPKALNQAVRRLESLLVCAIAIILGTELWLLRASAISFTPWMPSFQNIVLLFLTPLLILIAFLLIARAAVAIDYRNRKNKEYSLGNIDANLCSFAYATNIVVLVALNILAVKQLFPNLGSQPIEIEVAPLLVFCFGIATAYFMRIWLALVLVIFVMVFFSVLWSYISLFLRKFRSRKLAQLDKFLESEKRAKYEKFFRRFCIGGLVAMVVLLLLLLTWDAIPQDFTEEGFVATFVQVSYIIIAATMLYIFSDSFKSISQWIASFKDRRKIFRDIARYSFYRNLAITGFFVLLILFIRSCGLIPYLITMEYGNSPMFSQVYFITALPQYAMMLSYGLILATSGFWFYSFVPFCVYCYGWRPIEVAGIVFFTAFAVQEFIDYAVLSFTSNLPLSFFGAFVSFTLAYIVTNRLDKYIKNRFGSDIRK